MTTSLQCPEFMEDHIIGLMQVIEEKFSHIASNTVYHPALQSFRWREDEALRRGILREIIVTSTRYIKTYQAYELDSHIAALQNWFESTAHPNSQPSYPYQHQHQHTLASILDTRNAIVVKKLKTIVIACSLVILDYYANSRVQSLKHAGEERVISTYGGIDVFKQLSQTEWLRMLNYRNYLVLSMQLLKPSSHKLILMESAGMLCGISKCYQGGKVGNLVKRCHVIFENLSQNPYILNAHNKNKPLLPGAAQGGFGQPWPPAQVITAEDVGGEDGGLMGGGMGGEEELLQSALMEVQRGALAMMASNTRGNGSQPSQASVMVDGDRGMMTQSSNDGNRQGSHMSQPNLMSNPSQTPHLIPAPMPPVRSAAMPTPTLPKASLLMRRGRVMSAQDVLNLYESWRESAGNPAEGGIMMIVPYPDVPAIFSNAGEYMGRNKRERRLPPEAHYQADTSDSEMEDLLRGDGGMYSPDGRMAGAGAAGMKRKKRKTNDGQQQPQQQQQGVGVGGLGVGQGQGQGDGVNYLAPHMSMGYVVGVGGMGGGGYGVGGHVMGGGDMSMGMNMQGAGGMPSMSQMGMNNM